LLIVMAVLGLIMSERLNRLAANTVGASRTGA
jgi:hypothetical protein